MRTNYIRSLHFCCVNAMGFISYARSATRCTRFIRNSRLSSGSRHASTYNAEVAGLSEEQAEVRRSMGDDRPYSWLIGVVLQFRNAVSEFAQREIAPRAAEIDRTNTFPVVSFAFLYLAILSQVTSGCLGKTWRYGLAWRNSLPQVWRVGIGLLPSYLGHGRAFTSVWLGRTVLWCPLKPLRQPNPSTWYGSAESEVSP